jgi:hypothetical protein
MIEKKKQKVKKRMFFSYSSSFIIVNVLALRGGNYKNI